MRTVRIKPEGELGFLRLEPNTPHVIRVLDKPVETYSNYEPSVDKHFESHYIQVIDLADKTPKMLRVSNVLRKTIQKAMEAIAKHKEQFRFPRSKKKRIRKKWASRPENWRPVQNYDIEILKRGIGLGTNYLVAPLAIHRNYETAIRKGYWHGRH